MKNTLWPVFTGLVLLLGLPLLGVYRCGLPVAQYLEFPPRLQYVVKLPYSPLVFTWLAGLIVIVLLPFVLRAITTFSGRDTVLAPARRFPWWGWTGLALGSCSWFIAWMRFEGLAAIQPHTFPLLWLCYILVINGVTYRRTGRCVLTHRPVFLLALFPASAVFWWFFEYLNRFVQNWQYLGSGYGPWAYFWLATLSFSTVLPAFISTRDWLWSFTWWREAYRSFMPLNPPFPAGTAWLALLIAAAGLFFIGCFPNVLFPLLWVAPLIVIVSLQQLSRRRHLLSGIAAGDWSLVVVSAVAALVCGLCWELWNLHSLAKWRYEIPLVQRFSIFEMPVLGYAGYLPFGLECATVLWLLGDRPVGARAVNDR